MTIIKEYDAQPAAALQKQAKRLGVFIEGQLCNFLEVAKIIRQGYPHISFAQLAVSKGITPVEITHMAGMGRPIEIYESLQNTDGSDVLKSRCIFTGTIEGMESRFDNKHWNMELTAKDFGAALDRRMIRGQRRSDEVNGPFLDEAVRCIFNQNDQPNRARDRIWHDGKNYYPFAGPEEKSQWWTAAQAVEYLLCEYVLYGELVCDAAWKMEQWCGDMILYDLNVTSTSAFEAIGKICRLCGIGFYLAPSGNDIGPRQRIVFYQPGGEGSAELFIPGRDDNPELSETCIVSVRRRQDFHPVVQAFTGVGEIREYEATFELQPGWDDSLEGLDATYYKRSAINFESVQDVYRKWVLNEAGDYVQPGYDLSPIFGTADYRKIRRRFYKSLTLNDKGESEGICLEVSYDGITWHRYADSYRVLSGECGVWLSSYAISGEIWQAWFDGTLRFRVTAVIRGDNRLRGRYEDGPAHSCAPVLEHTVRLPRKFAYRIVTPQSRFYDEVLAGTRESEQTDDQAPLDQYLRQYGRSHRYVFEKTQVETALPCAGFWPGQRILACPDGRNLLELLDDDQSRVWIEKAVIDMQKQKTVLDLLRSRMDG